MRGNTVLQGTLILLAAGLFTRFLGFFYRILLSRLVGLEAMGLIQMVFPVLLLATTLATAGLPVAIAKLVAEKSARGDTRGIAAVLRASTLLVLATSGTFSLAILLSARFLSTHLLSDPRSYYPLLVLGPGVVVISLGSILRGYFQGLQSMTPAATAQVVEQVTRIAGALILLGFFLPLGPGYAAAGAVLGMMLGEVGGVLTLLLFFRARPRLLPGGAVAGLGSLREVLSLSLPVTLTRLVNSGTEVLDATVIPRRLEAGGMPRDAATAFFGALTGMAVPLLFFPAVVTSSLSTALVPAISEATVARDLRLARRRAEQAIFATILVALPSGAAFLVLGHPLGQLFYGHREVGDLMVPLAVAAPFLYLEQTLSAVFRGLGRPTVPMGNGIVGSTLRLGIIYFLAAVPALGVRAVLWGIVADLALCFTLNFAALGRGLSLGVDLKNWLGKPLLATGVMLVATWWGYTTLAQRGELTAVGGALALGGAGYLLCLLGTRGPRPLRS